MDGADFGMTERIRPRIEVAAPILERRRTAKNENIATVHDLDAPAYLVAVFPVVETIPSRIAPDDSCASLAANPSMPTSESSLRYD